MSLHVEEEHLMDDHKNCNGELRPPGLEIYRDERVSVFEVAGITERIYCENLCLIAKLFLDHKNIRFDCSPFLFYILVSREDNQRNLAGYFSKEYGPKVDNNLSCILTFPHFQRKGFGKFLIEFSYELSKIEKKKGTPERPLSDLGFRSYITFWATKIIFFFLETDLNKVSIHAISDATFIEQNDVLYILENFRIIRKLQNGQIQLYLKREYLETILENIGVKKTSKGKFVDK